MIFRVATFAWLLLIWVALAGAVSLGGALLGAALSAGLLAYFRSLRVPADRMAFRPLHAVRLLGFFAIGFLAANLEVALAVLRPERIRNRRAIVAVPIAGVSELTTLVLANVVCLTPGTFVLEMHEDPAVLYVHALRIDTARDLRLAILEMERRIVLAIGPAGADQDVRQLMALVASDELDEGRHVSWKPSR